MSERRSTTATEPTVDSSSGQQQYDEEKATPPSPPTQPTVAHDPNLVTWTEDDRENPRNWARGYKAFVTVQLGMLAMAASLGSSIISPASDELAAEYGLDQVSAVLPVSLYVLGFALGPMLWAPISEIWGRRWSLLPPLFCLGLFSIGTAVSNTTASIFITRFFGGLYASSPVSNVSAAMGDLYHPEARGIAITFYALCVVGGPLLGPVIGSALTVTVGWRWTEYVEAIWVFANVCSAYFFLPEMHGPYLLKQRAQRLRKETGNANLYHPHEHMKLDPKTVVTKYFTRPLYMLLTEQIVTLIAFYASFTYALLYMTLQVFPIVFEDLRGYSPVVASLPFIAMFIGIFCAVGINLANQRYYHQQVEKAGGKAVPEARLPPVMIGGVLFCGGLFWFGWTAAPQYHWILPCIAAAVVGAGFNTIFQQCMNYLVDSFATYAASAVAANTILRSILAAALPLTTRPMFDALGVGPAVSVLGGVAGLLIPVPFLFAKYGPRIRARSKFAAQENR